MGNQGSKPIKFKSNSWGSEIFADNVYTNGKAVATQEWVLQQLANYVSKTGDSTVTGTITATSFKES